MNRYLLLAARLLPLSALLLTCGSGCGGQGSTPPSTEFPAEPAVDLPAPNELVRGLSYAPADRIQLGAEFDHALPTNLVMEFGNYTAFMPHYDPDTNPLYNGMAYDMHRFGLAGYSDEPALYYRWIVSLEHFEAGSHWIALANWHSNRWQWFSCDTSGRIELESLEPYIRPGGGDVIVVPLVYRGEDTTPGHTYNGLQYLRFGERVGRWLTETADADANAWLVALAISEYNIPHVAYMDGELLDMDLKYATLSSGGWLTEDLDTANNTGWYPSITTYIDSHEMEMPIICYRNSTEDLLYTARCVSREIVVGGYGWDWSLVELGLPGAWSPDYVEQPSYFGMSYFDEPTSHLMYSYFNGLSWVPYTVDDSGVTGEISRLLLDGDGHPCIVYTNSDTDSIHYARYTGTAWELITIEDTAAELGNPHFTLAPDGTPNVSYHDYTHQMTVWAWFDGADWQSEAVYDLEAHGDANDIVVDSAGVPHIAAVDIDSLNLKHFWREPVSENWLGDTLEFGAGHMPCLFLDMEIDSQDRISIAYSGYHDGADKALKFAYQVD
jgi:hypothetical protein